MTGAPRRWGILVALFGATLAHDVAAEPTSQERALAESLFRDANALVKSKDFDAACPKFEESHRLDPQLGTLLYLATCHEQQGKTASAWAEFSASADLASQRGDERREKIARARADELEPNLSRVTFSRVDSATPANVEIRLDDKKIGDALLGTAVPVDPGTYVVTMTADGFESFEREIEVDGDGDRVTVELGNLDPSDEGPVEKPPIDAPEGSALGTTGWVLVGVGGASLLLSMGMGVAAAVQRDAADEECDGRFCTDEGLDMHDTSRMYATVSTVAVFLGIASAGVGIALVVAAPSPNETEAWLHVAPHLGGGTLSYGGRW